MTYPRQHNKRCSKERPKERPIILQYLKDVFRTSFVLVLSEYVSRDRCDVPKDRSDAREEKTFQRIIVIISEYRQDGEFVIVSIIVIFLLLLRPRHAKVITHLDT